jgi:hypothetical protein
MLGYTHEDMSDSISRRAFLQTTAALTTAAAITPSLALPANAKPVELPYPENGTLIPDEGWHLWVDDKAEWQNDDIFLPEDIAWVNGKLCGKGQPLPVNAPTGGWSALTPDTGLEVILPTSVEQHFWGKYGAGPDGKPRPYTPEEYRYAATDPPKPPADDDIPQNGAYFGVSWWFRPIDIPLSMKAKRIFLHIRGAHLRAEVYLNQKLVGYSIMEDFPSSATAPPPPAFPRTAGRRSTSSPSASPTPSAASTGSTASTPNGARSRSTAPTASARWTAGSRSRHMKEMYA